MNATQSAPLYIKAMCLQLRGSVPSSWNRMDQGDIASLGATEGSDVPTSSQAPSLPPHRGAGDFPLCGRIVRGACGVRCASMGEAARLWQQDAGLLARSEHCCSR